MFSWNLFCKTVGFALLFASLYTHATTWYLKAGNATGKGTAQEPFNSMEALGNLAEEGDTLVILPSDEPFKGKIELKSDQILKGGGVITCGGTPFGCKVSQPGAKITNPDGDTILLADNVQIMGIDIIKPAGYAIYGKNVRNVKISNTHIVNANQAAQLQYDFDPPPELRGLMTHFLGKKYNNRSFPKAAIAFAGDDDNGLDAIEISNCLIDGENNSGTKGPAISVLLEDKSFSGITMEKNMIEGSELIPGVLPNYSAGIYFLVRDEAEGRLKISDLAVNHLKLFNDGMDLLAFDDAKLYVQIKNYQFYGSELQGNRGKGLETFTAYGPGKFAPLVKMTATEHHAQIILRMEDSLITGSGGPGLSVCNLLGNASRNVIDLGQGPQTQTGTFIDSPSVGQNSLYNNSCASSSVGVDVVVINGTVHAKNNWWGNKDTITSKSGSVSLSNQSSRLCGVNLTDNLCQKGDISHLYTEPALKKGDGKPN